MVSVLRNAVTLSEVVALFAWSLDSVECTWDTVNIFPNLVRSFCSHS